MSTWTDERTDTLKRLWIGGLSASEIARELGGITRNAVIGKVDRLGLLARAKPSKPGQSAAKAAVARKARLVVAGGGCVIQAPEAPPPRVEIPDDVYAPLPGSTPRPWTERKAGECTWLVGEGLSCCNAVHARGWCASHHAIGTVKAKPVKKQRPDRKIGASRRFAA